MAKANPKRQDAEALRREHHLLLARYLALVQRWNQHVDLFNEHVPRPMGRPLNATPEQAARIRELHTSGLSLRRIALEVGTPLSAVRTVLDRGEQALRWRELLKRIEPERDFDRDLTAILRRQSGKRPLTRRSDR